MEFRLHGPKHFFRYPDSVHILEMYQLELDAQTYRNTVPITMEDLARLRDTITEWLGDDYGSKG